MPSLVMLLAALSACDATPPSYFPLDADRYWQYTIARTTMDGERTLKDVVTTRPAETWRGTRVHVRETLDGSRMYYTSDATTGISRVAERAPGTDDPQPRTPPRIVLPPSPVPGASWQGLDVTEVLESSGAPWENLFRLRQPVTLTYTVESMTDTVSVPAGEFHDCLRVVGRGEAGMDTGDTIGRGVVTVEVIDWYAPGVGLVRSLRTERTDRAALDQGSSLKELESYR